MVLPYFLIEFSSKPKKNAMKRNITHGIAIVTLLFVGTPAGLFAQTTNDDFNTISTAVPFLKITPDARGAGYGDQGAATPADINSQFYNASKYVWCKSQGGLSYSYTPWLRNLTKGMNVSYLSGYFKFDDRQAVSASFRYFSMGDVAFTDVNGSLIKNYSPNELSFDVAYSRMLSPNLSASIGFRYIHSSLTDDAIEGAKAGNSFAADLGVYYQRSIDKNEMAAGISIANIGSKISYGSEGMKGYLPTNLRIGLRYTYNINETNAISALLETTKLLVPTPDYDENNVDKNADKSAIGGIFSSFGDAPSGFSEEMKEFTYSIGTEYSFQNMFMLRGGYFHESKMKGNSQFFTIGAGISYKFAKLDFAYLIPSAEGSTNPMAHTFRFSLGVNIDSRR